MVPSRATRKVVVQRERKISMRGRPVGYCLESSWSWSLVVEAAEVSFGGVVGAGSLVLVLVMGEKLVVSMSWPESLDLTICSDIAEVPPIGEPRRGDGNGDSKTENC